MSSWPRWMTLPVVSAASSLLSWDQLSGGLQRALEPLGGAYDSWVVHHAPEAFYVTGPSPTTWYAAPWMQRLRQPPTAEERLEVIWHKGVDDRGLIISQGPGSSSRRSSFGSGKVDWTFWAIPRKFRALDQHRNQRAPPQGFDEHGKPSAAGPFWLVCAPELSDLLNDGGEHQLRADDPEALQAAQGLEKLSRIQHCQPGSKTLDYAELFSASSALPLIRASGLRIPPDHELFCEAAGWHEDKKEHRQRLRRFLRERNPGLIGISLSDGLPLQGSERDCVWTLLFRLSDSCAAALRLRLSGSKWPRGEHSSWRIMHSRRPGTIPPGRSCLHSPTWFFALFSVAKTDGPSSPTSR